MSAPINVEKIKNCAATSRKTKGVEHSGTKLKNSAKNPVRKFVKLTDHTCVCNDLTNFEYGAHVMTGNGTYVKNSSNPFRWTYFRRILALWNQCVVQPRLTCHAHFSSCSELLSVQITKYFKKERRKIIIAKSYLVRVIYILFFLVKTQKNQILLVQYYIAHRAGEERYYVHFNTHRHFVIHFHVCRFDKSPAHEVLKINSVISEFLYEIKTWNIYSEQIGFDIWSENCKQVSQSIIVWIMFLIRYYPPSQGPNSTPFWICLI